MAKRIETLLMRLNLVDRFRLTSSVILILALLAIGTWIARVIDSGVVRITASTTALYMESVVTPLLGDLARSGELSPDTIAALDRLLQNTALGNHILAFKIWGPNGRVLYAPDRRIIGQGFPVEDRLARAWQGETTSRISNLESVENVDERQLSSQALETYSPIHVEPGDQIVAVAEFYQNVDELKSEISRAQLGSWLVTTGIMLAIYLLLVGFVKRSGRTIAYQQDALSTQVVRLSELLAQNAELHERVRQGAAQTATLNEHFLRRISAELHDGPVQELSVALLRLDPVPEDATAAAAGSLQLSAHDAGVIRASLGRALEETRAISSGLGLPLLDSLSLSEVVSRAVRAHESRTGTHVAVQIPDLYEHAPLALKITTYRVIQEALTNAYRHAGGAGQSVCIERYGDSIEVKVSDAGPGFAADQPVAEGDRAHLGLAGMRERVQSMGGTFHIESSPGEGSTVRAVVPLHVPEDVYARVPYNAKLASTGLSSR